ncbi:MAG TPA: ribonuclease H-like domain-containing protein [Syntrophorhabdaceae bacterium]|jgi:hypothetical protein|nr:ribonuclease H-like domain-containing protein [Syntrophorhabdaceae bacterium]MDI9560576.1 ribonuclease H-like domain-containing protein [Pseudomonadota bacterium]HPH41519.1 ribonuclease H-like domain-containing protein [Syntrophorhabdaceae bacterium]HQG50671.1 ribonuclease H-like domain-containing protein [Syntrophorhabdaceae bacterium]HQI56574.1 ribonuclease H-like domain-containing protein [Syntrophorhabdaceae bacterium]
MKAYLDIETDRHGNICVIGIYIEQKGFIQLYGDDITTDNVETIIRKAKTVVTFNGDVFDLPAIKKYLNLDIKAKANSLDLFKEKKKLGIKGGLKALEKMFGITRKTEGMNGYDAIKLWERYRKYGRDEALNLLLEYNREDVINLISLENCLENLKENHYDRVI